ncbi:hypothetical protein G6F65_013863 [Rhizopus arrhizus]|nr:hypothetical protein G6F65_013863 [Rhizopus arrhizus]
MSEDDSSSSPAEHSEKKRGWLERLTSAFSGEPHTRDELVAVLHTAQEEGLIAADTLKMMEGAISVAELTVGDVMISRSQMVSLPVEAPFLELMKQVVESGHSRFPVHGENKDDILGILLAKDLLRGVVADNGPANVRELLRPAVLIPEAKKLNVLLKEFRLSRNHMAIVVDEYGGVAGLVTIEDVLEQIVGEIDDEHDEAEDPSAQIAIQSDGQYVVDALTPIGDFNERFGATFSDEDYDTIGGLVTEAVGHLPEVGDELALDRFMFRVARADARRRLKRGGPVQALRLTVWLALCVLAMVLPLAASAQPAATTPAPAAPVASAEAPAPRIGVVTMQPGTVFFERFGHDAIVVIDPASGEATSYNFGYFDPSEDDFISRFMRGDMMYYLVALPLQQDLSYYDETGRGASVQWLDLRPDQARALAADLAERAKPENARYHYDYYTANCATMVRDT